MKKIILVVIAFLCIQNGFTLNHLPNNEIKAVSTSVYFDSDTKTIEINLHSKDENSENIYTIVIKNRKGETVMDFETNVSYNLINASVFKKGKYSYQVIHNNTELQSGDFKIKRCKRN